ncbi:DUF4234 domain-containing protein [Streptomyces abyssalis]|uniref:DUF4234 domain-containing protein n=1 Tax=Streptomyces abyssalis TaxID=933944 RepID=UPI001C0B0D2D|nr:DUF4234 domain-containing protein [Streptomyces abyssalis]
MGKTRNVFLVWLVWPLITLGVYHLVWYFKVNREAHSLDERIEVNPWLSVLAIALGWVLIVPPFVSVYRTGRRIGQMQRSAGTEPTCNGWIGLALVFVFHLTPLYYQSELNRIWDQYEYVAEGERITLAA